MHDRIELDRADLTAVLDAAGIDARRLRACEPLAEGTFNTAYRLRLAQGPDLVLKVAPGPSSTVMGYEHGMMRTEELFYRTAGDRVPVPEVVHADYGRQVVRGDVLLMTHRPGRSWSAWRDDLSPGEHDRLRSELGGLVARLHRITGPGFGYPQAGLADRWRTAFLGMVDAVLADARRFDAPLPVPADRIADAVRRRADLLDDVRTPVLVHFDLWPGNILLDDTGGGPAVSAIVDGERAFWGDPLAETVSLSLFGDIAEDPAFARGYRAAGGTLDLDGRSRGRLALYRCYLYLVMAVEAVPRGTVGPRHEPQARLVRRALLAALDGLG
ncbi:phosphotransferase family protein [Nocardiopsis aegyptia]|uniref:phosphotransferase family protein n=1 Tax=Nocardiopsis aegyptia TaxID=220378 RepID=UPI00366E1C91